MYGCKICPIYTIGNPNSTEIQPDIDKLGQVSPTHVDHSFQLDPILCHSYWEIDLHQVNPTRVLGSTLLINGWVGLVGRG